MLLIARFAVVMIHNTSLIDWASRRVLCQSQQPNVAVNTAHNKVVSGLTHQASHFVTLNSGVVHSTSSCISHTYCSYMINPLLNGELDIL